MSLLINESYANPTVPIWSNDATDTRCITGGGNGLAQNFPNTVGNFSVASSSFTAPKDGTVVVTATVTFVNTASTAGLYTAFIKELVTSGQSTSYTNLPAGNTTAQYGNVCVMLTLNVTKGQILDYELLLNGTNGTATPKPTYNWDWNVAFYSA